MDAMGTTQHATGMQDDFNRKTDTAYPWRACGLSANPLFCNTSHDNT